MSPYIIFGPPHRCPLKNLFDPPKNLFQQYRSDSTETKLPAGPVMSALLPITTKHRGSLAVTLRANN